MATRIKLPDRSAALEPSVPAMVVETNRAFLQLTHLLVYQY